MTTCGTLMCGIPPADGNAKAALTQLNNSIDIFYNRSIFYLKNDFTDETKMFGAFCARVLLENACAALVGRLDPFRLLYLSEFQTQLSYDSTKSSKSGFKWTGDVISEDRPANTLWGADHDLSKVNRALLSQYLDHIYWKPAIEKALDHISSTRNPNLASILELDAENFISSTKGKCTQLYSKLSKGVHWEYFSSALVIDEPTIKTAIRDTCNLISHLGLMSHFIPTAYACLSPDQAVSEYVNLREELQ